METSLTSFQRLTAIVRGVAVLSVLFLFQRCITPALAAGQDTTVSSSIKTSIAKSGALYFPASVKRFYENNGYQLTWIAPATVKTHAAEAMLMLDCVLQFGLNYADYHPQYLTYRKLKLLTENFDKQPNNEKAEFDIILTDALISYMNHLHYGKLNPYYPADKIEAATRNGFDAAAALAGALRQKDFMSAFLSVQPQSAAYKALQYHMHLLTGLFTGDCYEIPDSVVRKMAVNLERLRWMNSNDKTCIEVNIPSYTLTFHRPGAETQFKVIVGKPDAPTPTLQSAISYFETAPEWRIPQKIFRNETLVKALKNKDYLENSQIAVYSKNGKYIPINRTRLLEIKRNPRDYYATQSSGCDNSLGLIVFRFPNVYDIYLHDTPEQKLFNTTERAYSHGCIRVEQAEKLAGLLLKNEGSESKIPAVHHDMAASKHQTFMLKKPVPIKVTYLTCSVNKGILSTYKDIYKLDNSLDMALYNTEMPLAMK